MASVRKDDIPMMAMFMPKLWELIKEFYLAFCKFIDSKQKELRKNVQTEV